MKHIKVIVKRNKPNQLINHRMIVLILDLNLMTHFKEFFCSDELFYSNFKYEKFRFVLQVKQINMNYQYI